MKNNQIKHIDLSKIKNPDFIKQLSYQELDVLSHDIATYLIDITSKNGGHLSSNLGVVDATIALCKIFDFTKDKIIFDVGHQSYTYKLLTGRDLSKLRKQDGISGYQKRNESAYDHYEAGHSSTSISSAIGMAIARDLNGDHYDVIAFIGDSSVVNGLSLEALNNSYAKERKHKIIIILNDNDMSISSSVGGFSLLLRKLSVSNFYRKSRKALKKIMSKTRLTRKIYALLLRMKNYIKNRILRTSFLDDLGFSCIGPIDGHDIKEMARVFSQVKKNDKSTIILLKTIKGKGYKYAEEDRQGKWHGVPAFNKLSGEFYQSNDLSWSQYYANLINKKMNLDKHIVTITPGTGYGSGLYHLFKQFPERMIDVGIAEEHAFVLASGLATSGYHPIICIYSTFLQRSYDEISHDLARMKLNATILVDRAGLVGKDGETHQGLYDVAFLSSIPNVTIAMPSNTYEANALFLESFLNHGPFFIRFCRANVNKCVVSYPLPYGKWHKMIDHNNKTLIISCGPIISSLNEAILSNNKPADLYNAIYIKPIDQDAIIDSCKYQRIIIYDCYNTINGMSNIIASELAKKHYQGELIIKSLPDEFVGQGEVCQQLKQFGLWIDDIINLI